MSDGGARRRGLAAFLRRHPLPNSIIVNPELRILYMKAAKTAGTSILRATFDQELGGFLNRKNTPEAHIEWIATITDEELEAFYIFSEVRNPYDRFLSMCGHFGMMPGEVVDRYEDLIKGEPYGSHMTPQIFNTHMDGEVYVDRIMRFERISEEFTLFSHDTGLALPRLPHVNRSDRTALPERLDPKARGFVERVYRADLAAYGYTADGWVEEGAGA